MFYRINFHKDTDTKIGGVMMKKHKLILLGLLVLPWLSIPLIKKSELKKYLPSVMFITILTRAIDEIGVEKKWWRFYKGISIFNSMDFFILGPYVVSSFWMLKLSYGKFPQYLVLNLTMQILFTFFGGVKYAKRFKIFTLDRISRLQYILSTFFRAITLYGFQYIIDFSHNRNRTIVKK